MNGSIYNSLTNNAFQYTIAARSIDEQLRYAFRRFAARTLHIVTSTMNSLS